ncbi:MAG: hypothetical protein DRP71_02255 [Verrucomicrobia bacterium]|nr:MAG: hypothetical protein DRP71_02255 [Verrucomicrobiota bacterium]
MKVISVLTVAAFLTACSTVPTDVHYGEVGAVAGIDGGYSELRRGIDTWAIRYTGDRKMTGSTVRDLTLLRSAEVAQKAAFQWFVVTEKVDESGHNLQGTSFSGVQTTQTSSSWAGGQDTLTGSRTVDTRFICQYRYEIKCYREDPGDPEALDVAVVETELRTKYGIGE